MWDEVLCFHLIKLITVASGSWSRSSVSRVLLMECQPTWLMWSSPILYSRRYHKLKSADSLLLAPKSYASRYGTIASGTMWVRSRPCFAVTMSCLRKSSLSLHCSSCLSLTRELQTNFESIALSYRNSSASAASIQPPGVSRFVNTAFPSTRRQLRNSSAAVLL